MVKLAANPASIYHRAYTTQRVLFFLFLCKNNTNIKKIGYTALS